MSKYSIYPTLLDAFTFMRTAEDDAVRVKAEAELIDKINRVEVPPTYQAVRGTALNEVLDAYLAGTARAEGAAFCIEKDFYQFAFDADLVARLADWVGATPVCQPYLEASVDTAYGEVKLYGYADYVQGHAIIDLKSCDTYTVGKYSDKWQHRIYPLLAVRSGMMEDVDTFEYLVAELDKNNPQGGEVYREDYTVNLVADEREVRDMLECEFLPWLESKRELITDKKIFGL